MGKAPSGFQIEDKSEVESHLRSIFQTLKKPFIYFEDDPALVVAILHREIRRHDTYFPCK